MLLYFLFSSLAVGCLRLNFDCVLSSSSCEEGLPLKYTREFEPFIQVEYYLIRIGYFSNYIASVVLTEGSS